MATITTEKPALEAEKVVEAPVAVEAQPPEPVAPRETLTEDRIFAIANVVLRYLLFASALTAVVVIATSKQTKGVYVPAKFQDLPALIYFVAANSVAGLYSIITSFLSLYALFTPNFYPQLLSQFVFFDVLLLGIVASATGVAGTVGYIGLKGYSHVGWKEVCGMYDVFCRHIGASAGVSLFGSIVLVLLVSLSVYSLLKKAPK